MIIYLLLLSLKAFSFEVISHKGVHHQECLDFKFQCQSHCLRWKNHSFIENTIPSIREAFRVGADRVEFDLQLSRDEKIVVFHDDHLRCRANVNRFVSELTVAELKKLDIAAGFRFIGIEGNPMLGKGVGRLSTFKEVMTEFPDRKFLINPKREDEKFIKILISELTTLFNEKVSRPENIAFWGGTKVWLALKKAFPSIGPRFSHAFIGRHCEEKYFSFGWTGFFPKECKGFHLALHEDYTYDWMFWGGLVEAGNTFRKHNVPLFIIHPKNLNSARIYQSLDLGGIITSKIEELNE